LGNQAKPVNDPMHTALKKLNQHFSTSELNKIEDPILQASGVELWIKRDDQLHPIISGNKWRKLKYILDHALCLGSDTLISMGGAYSNHLHALAYVGKLLDIKTKGLIRGEPGPELTCTLKELQDWGMELEFVSRTAYRELRHHRGHYDLPGLQPNQYWLPEGGSQPLALRGVAEIVHEIVIPYDVLCVPCGTGTTLAGLIASVPEHISVLGISALKNAAFLNTDVKKLLSCSKNNWQINLDYHCGGFAKTNPELLYFIDRFEHSTKIPLEPVYTAKMLFALYDLIEKKVFKSGQRIIAIHTGGLQGKRGFTQ
jgi:1-aminocyclopropane-1-carboxylate deaminase